MRSHFASDRISCTATFIGKIVGFEFNYFEGLLKKRRVFPRHTEILTGCTIIIAKRERKREREKERERKRERERERESESERE